MVMHRLTLLLLTTGLIPQPAVLDAEPPCPHSWVDANWMQLGCLLFSSSTGYGFEDASNYCQENNATLIEIQTEAQREFITMELYALEAHEDKRRWWTAGTDLGVEGRWVWMISLTPVGSFMWMETQPNNGLEGNCLYLYPNNDYLGADDDCRSLHYPICQSNQK